MPNASSSVASTTSQNISNVLGPSGTSIAFDSSGNVSIINPSTQTVAQYLGSSPAPQRQPYFTYMTATGITAGSLQFSPITTNTGLCGYIGSTPQNVTFSSGVIKFPVAGTYLIEVSGIWYSTNSAGTIGSILLSAPSAGVTPLASTLTQVIYGGTAKASVSGAITVTVTQAGTINLSLGVDTAGFTATFSNGSLKISRIDAGT